MRPARSLLIVLSLVGYGIVGQASQPRASSPARPAIHGIVRDTAGKPVANALVALTSQDEPDAPPELVRSAADGTFTLARPPSGHHGLTASAAGRTGAFRPDVDPIAGDIELMLGRDEGVTMSGVTLDLDGKPLANAVATLWRLSNIEGDAWYAPVDGQGRFVITLPSAKYLVSATAPGFRTDKQHMTTEHGQAPPLTIEMQPEDPAGPPVLDELRAVAIPLQSCDPATPTLADLQPLAHALGDAHLVGLGEGTHGGHEMFQLKHRLFEFLVEKLGFTVLGLEASWADTLAIEEYLATGRGDPELLLPGIGFWVWDTTELTELLRWMRAYNVDPRHARKLHMVGFDMQFSPRSVTALLAYIGQHDRAYATRLARSLADLANDLDEDRFTGGTAAQRAAVASEVSTLRRYLDAQRSRLVARSGAAPWELARRHAEILSQYVDLNGDPSQYDEKRDRYMMRNVDWILAQQPAGTKMALWAHNGHVQKRPFGGSAPSMGQLLQQQHGDDYRALLTLFDSGTFRAGGASSPPHGLIAHTVSPAPIGNVEGTLARLGFDLVAIDLHALQPDSPGERWSHYRLSMRTFGSDYFGRPPSLSVRPAEAADVLVLIRQLTASHYLGPDWEPQPPQLHAGNLDFEELPTRSPPAHWQLSDRGLRAGYRAAVDTTGCHAGARCALLTRSGPRLLPAAGALQQSIDATPWRGRRVRVRAAVRVETQDPQGGARLLLATDTDRGGVIDTRMTPGPLIRTQQWQEYEVELDVAPHARAVRFGLAITGDAKAWLDAVDVAALGPAAASAR